MNDLATIIPAPKDAIEVNSHCQMENGTYWLELKVSDWDDVKKHNKDTLLFQGREYGWSCWNSDRMVSVFRSPPFPKQYATVKRKA